MKNLVYLIFVLSIFSSCIKNKSVIEPLDEDDIISLIEKDSLYEGVIKSIELARDEFVNDIVLRSKFKDISYEDYLNYKKQVEDTVFIKNIKQRAEKEFVSYSDSLLLLYKDDIDSVRAYWKKEYNRQNPENYFSVKFNDYDHLSLSPEKDDFIWYEISTKKGPIEGGGFSIRFTPKVLTSSIEGWVNYYFSDKVTKKEVWSWNPTYSMENEFSKLDGGWFSDYYSVIIEKYHFEYKINSVRVNGTTYSLENINIPNKYKEQVSKKDLISEDYFNLISHEFDVNTLSQSDYFLQLFKQEKYKIDRVSAKLEELINKSEE